MENIEYFAQRAVDLTVAYGGKILLAVLTLIIGLYVIKLILRPVRASLERSKVDATLQSFLVNMVNWGLKVALFISIASIVGIETTSFVAVLGAASLAVGLALQGTLANFAGGALILLFKPYKVGDLIEAQGHLGTVEEIQLFTTHLASLENKNIIIPNGALSNGSITNYTARGKLRVDLTVGIAYESDIKQAREVLLQAMQNDELVLDDPAPLVAVSELADSAINLAVRPYCKPEHYWDVYFGTLEACKEALDKAGITIPFPQRDVHLFQQTN